jgi:hypothetical protein
VNAGSLSPHVETVLSSCAPLWNQTRGLPEQRILRLAILRDLIRSMHAERSRLLALSQPDRADALRMVEPSTEALKFHPLAEASLPELVASRPERLAKPSRSPIPPELEAAAGGEGKFNRYDRQWEAEIAGEACRIGWGFWTMEAWIDIAKAENFHQALNQGLWPRGIVLFVESCSDTSDSPEDAAHSRSIWKGRWLIAHAPEQAPPGRSLGDLPGAVRPPRAADWRLLFAPAPA